MSIRRSISLWKGGAGAASELAPAYQLPIMRRAVLDHLFRQPVLVLGGHSPLGRGLTQDGHSHSILRTEDLLAAGSIRLLDRCSTVDVDVTL